MLQQTAPGRRRLHWFTDPFHPQRQGPPDQLGTRITPVADDLPVELRPLLDWYADINRWGRSQGAPQSDQLLGLRGKGRGVWGAEDPDAYIQRLRSTWP